jgi:uncharacterized protein DUF6665
MARRPVDLVAALEAEIRGEKASSLGRMGDRLEQLLGEMAALDRDIAAAADPSERQASVDAYNACRARAEETHYWLCVQREAMGLRTHESLVALYPIPPRRR